VSKARKPRRARKGLVIGSYAGAEDEVSPDGELEIRNEKIIVHEPLAGRVKGIKDRTGMTYQQILHRAFEVLQEQLALEDMATKKRE
jgi:hypothetical protein